MELLSELYEAFYYEPDTGYFMRRNRKGSKGSLDAYGYLILKINGRQHKAHRMAWLYVYGRMPEGVIDHINGNKLDNRIANLRDVPQAVNNKNSHKAPNKDTGERGIHISKAKGLKAIYTFKRDGKSHRFRTLQEAVTAKAA